VQRDDQRVIAQDHGHGLGRIASPLLLEHADRLGDLLRHGWVELFHGAISSFPVNECVTPTKASITPSAGFAIT
jgi:hypothetical protein